MKNISGITIRLVRIILSMLFVVNTIGGEAQDRSRTDSILATLSLNQKIELLLMPLPVQKSQKENSQEKGFLIYKPDTLGFVSKGVFKGKWPLLDVRNGFLQQSMQPPFPDANALASLKNAEDRAFLKNDLLHYLSFKGFIGVLGPANYLFNDFLADTVENQFSEGGQLSVWLFPDSGKQATRLSVLGMPDELFAFNQSHFTRKTKSKEIKQIISWPGLLGSLKAEFSFEKRVKYGHLFLSQDYQRDFNRLLRAYQAKWLNEEDLNLGCKRILEVMNRVSPPIFSPGKSNMIFNELVSRRAFEGGIRLFQKGHEPFPLTDLTPFSIAVVAEENMPARVEFTEMVNRYKTVTDDPEKTNLVFWLAHKEAISPEFVTERVKGIRQKFKDARVVMFWAGPPSGFELKTLPEGLDAIVAGSSNWPFVWKCMAQAAFSGLEINPGSPQEGWNSPLMALSQSMPATRLKYGIPLEVGLNPDTLQRIDQIVRDGISKKAMPGARVLIACRGVVVWDKSYGWHTYQRKHPVQMDDLFDLASVTKVTATLPSIMKLYDEGKWTLTDTLSEFFSEIDTTDKSHIVLKDLLLHQSGLPSFIPFYLNAIDREKLRGHLFSRRYTSLYSIKLDNRIYLNRTVSYRSDVFKKQKDSLFSVPVCQDMYMNRNYLDSIKTQVFSAPLSTGHHYLYSDLGFMFLGEMVHRITGLELDRYASENFYTSLGASTTTFLPLTRFPRERMIPTEQDNAFRKQLLKGWVHDPGSAMLGGVAGHAGLFSNAGDLAKIMQMLLNKGTYGGVRYLKPETIDLFTHNSNGDNRRGLGFDKPDLKDSKKSPASQYASPQSFGHSGFTGTLVWVDPALDLVYVFLSNRVHPHQYNKKLIEMNIRTRIQDVIYESLILENEEQVPDVDLLKALVL